MKVTRTVQWVQSRPDIIQAVLALLDTSIADIESYDELTSEEKQAITRAQFEELTSKL